MKCHVGCSGWFYWGWRGKFYPQDCPTHHWFAHYARHFKTVELNAPFYSWPKRSAIRCWVRQAPANFVYSIKVNRMITHEMRMAGTKMLIEQFYLDVAEPLGERMACFLFQFPPSFRYAPGRLKKLLAQLDPSYRNVLEFRHKSWWNTDTYRQIRKAKAIFCTVSAPRLPDTLIVSHGRAFVRLHGVTKWYRHDYSDDELKDWAAKIGDSGAEEVWIYFDNDRDANAIRNAKTLIRLLNRPRPRQRPGPPPRAGAPRHAPPAQGTFPARARRPRSRKALSFAS